MGRNESGEGWWQAIKRWGLWIIGFLLIVTAIVLVVVSVPPLIEALALSIARSAWIRPAGAIVLALFLALVGALLVSTHFREFAKRCWQASRCGLLKFGFETVLTIGLLGGIIAGGLAVLASTPPSGATIGGIMVEYRDRDPSKGSVVENPVLDTSGYSHLTIFTSCTEPESCAAVVALYAAEEGGEEVVIVRLDSHGVWSRWEESASYDRVRVVIERPSLFGATIATKVQVLLYFDPAQTRSTATPQTRSTATPQASR